MFRKTLPLLLGVVLASADQGGGGEYYYQDANATDYNGTTSYSDAENYYNNLREAVWPAYGMNMYADATQYYDGYQQSWRHLGWFVDCGTPSDRYRNSGSHASQENNNGYGGSHYCQRYLMWAAVSVYGVVSCVVSSLCAMQCL